MSIASTAQLSNFIPQFLVDNPIYQHRGAQALLFALGAGYFFSKLVSYGYAFFAPLFYKERDVLQRYGKDSWAFITGASDGIGKGFALELAARGLNIILLGRNKEKLEGVVQEIKEISPAVQTRVLVFDLCHAYKEGFAEKIFDEVKDLDISMLVNNAGIMVTGPYYETDIEKLREIIIVNCLAGALIVRAILPKLLMRNHKSAIINLSSKVASFPRPFQQIYACSKVFTEYLSCGLAYEHPNMDILAIAPGVVYTKLMGFLKPDMRTITPKELVEVSLRYLGRTPKTYGHWKHRWNSFSSDVIPPAFRIYWFQQKYPILKG